MEVNRGVILKMTTIADKFEAAKDRRTIFLQCYTMMTSNMLDALEENQFHDHQWVEQLLHKFAGYYFNALDLYDNGHHAPLVWTEVYEAAANKRLHVLQHLLLGVNAHINYDLVLTLYDMLSPEWNDLNDEMKVKRYEDHCLVNQIIGDTIDKVQDEVVEKYSPSMNIIDVIFGRLDEKLLLKLISKWRETVWQETQELLLIEEEKDRQKRIVEIEKRVLKKSDWLDTQFWFN